MIDFTYLPTVVEPEYNVRLAVKPTNYNEVINIVCVNGYDEIAPSGYLIQFADRIVGRVYVTCFVNGSFGFDLNEAGRIRVEDRTRKDTDVPTVPAHSAS